MDLFVFFLGEARLSALLFASLYRSVICKSYTDFGSTGMRLAKKRSFYFSKFNVSAPASHLKPQFSSLSLPLHLKVLEIPLHDIPALLVTRRVTQICLQTSLLFHE